MKLNKFLIFLFLTNLSFGQFQTTGKIKPVTKSGLHEIVLPPTVRSYSKQDLSDLRIFDSKENEIPYFIQENQDTVSDVFQEFAIISKTTHLKKNTSIIIKIPSTQNNNQLSLVIANSDDTKKFTISGSNNQKEWFGLSNSQTLSDLNSYTKTSVIKTITYPLNNYTFLKLDFNDAKTLPINILKVGRYNSQLQKNKLQEIIPKKSIITHNSTKKETQIHVVFSEPQIINHIVFEISKPTYYSRTASIYKKTIQKIKRKSRQKTKIYDEEITSFNLNSTTKNSFSIPEIFEKDFFIKIENQDNIPLSISKIKYEQKPVSIIADLDANKEYSLKMGDKNLREPQYDLSDFKTNISNNLPKTTVYDIQKENTLKKPILNKPFWQKSWFMWACILLGGITILFFSFSLIKDLKSKN